MVICEGACDHGGIGAEQLDHGAELRYPVRVTHHTANDSVRGGPRTHRPAAHQEHTYSKLLKNVLHRARYPLFARQPLPKTVPPWGKESATAALAVPLR